MADTDSRTHLHPANLIPELYRLFYHLGWVTGTGVVAESPSPHVANAYGYMHLLLSLLRLPEENTAVGRIGVTENEEIVWLYAIFLHTRGCVVDEAKDLCASLTRNRLWPGKEFRISHQMIKGIRAGGTGPALSSLETLVVPIIENTPYEEDLEDSMAEVMKDYPEAAAVLVRRHGIFCLDYLFEVAVKMKLFDLAVVLNENETTRKTIALDTSPASS
ncbi:hypothetical protein CPB85DRAFT_1553645 [Mucidula mucida]|nr:hypothetical protein CPB85DRAFT_1553645 [Mucidula mucida]